MVKHIVSIIDVVVWDALFLKDGDRVRRKVINTREVAWGLERNIWKDEKELRKLQRNLKLLSLE